MSVPLMRDFMRTRLGLRLHLEVDAFQLIQEDGKSVMLGYVGKDLRRTINAALWMHPSAGCCEEWNLSRAGQP